MSIYPLKLFLLVLCLWQVTTQIANATPVRGEHIEVELISEVSALQRGKPAWVGVRFNPDKHWHTYWRNPGDSGMSPKIEWLSPTSLIARGTAADSITEFVANPYWLWQIPQRIPYQHLVNFGYNGESLIITQLPANITENVELGKNLTLSAKVSWLVCEEICVPGEAELSLTLPVQASPAPINTRWQSAFTQVRYNSPQLQSHWQVQANSADKQLLLNIQLDTPLFAEAQTVTFFPFNDTLINHAAVQYMNKTANQLWLKVEHGTYFSKMPDKVSGVLVLQTPQGQRAYGLNAQIVPQLDTSKVNDWIPATTTPLLAAAITEPLVTETPSLLILLVFAFIGGFLLNLMPCVFPILSLKALSLLNTSPTRLHEQKMHGLIYTAGVILSFVIIALLLLSFRAVGENIGWGFQLQSPIFVALLAYLFFAMALSLSGLTQFGAQWMGLGHSLTQQEGYRGSLFTGILAVVVASPCTAPLMGTAIGVALTQAPPITVMIFTTLGLGMAFPFLLLALFPALGQRLPRVGAWMDILKQLLAFPLYLTVVWLLWVVGQQTSIHGMSTALVGLVFVAFALWLSAQQAKHQWIIYSLTLATLLLAIGLLWTPPMSVHSMSLQKSDSEREFKKQNWQVFSQQKINTLRAQQQPIFVNMTAAWCITCLVNEQVALNTSSVIQKMQEKGVHYLKGDWTNHDIEITEYLTKYQRSGVPLYVLYPANPQLPPQILPQLLTPTILIDALDKV